MARRFVGAEYAAFLDDIAAGRAAVARRSTTRAPRSTIVERVYAGGTHDDHHAQPLRISLGGGGTDLPSYYREHGGFLIAAAIDKYVYITLHRTFDRGHASSSTRSSSASRASTRSSTR